jgi:transcriptional regulator with XRE-family HTH domain
MMKTAPALKLWKTLGEYIESRRGVLLLSRRALARELKMSSSYLSNIVNGHLTPGADICNRISDYFKDPRDIALRLCGWLEREPVDKSDLNVRELVLFIKDDADLILFLQFYRNQSPATRRRLLKKIQETAV